MPQGVVHLKHITPTHWTWVIYQKERKTPVAVAGGTWTLEGDTYKERCDFAGTGFEHLRGTETPYASKVDGDRWSIKGTVSNGAKVDETWTRQK